MPTATRRNSTAGNPVRAIDKPDYTNPRIEPEMNNSYDSAILYTD